MKDELLAEGPPSFCSLQLGSHHHDMVFLIYLYIHVYMLLQFQNICCFFGPCHKLHPRIPRSPEKKRTLFDLTATCFKKTYMRFCLFKVSEAEQLLTKRTWCFTRFTGAVIASAWVDQSFQAQKEVPHRR